MDFVVGSVVSNVDIDTRRKYNFQMEYFIQMGAL